MHKKKKNLVVFDMDGVIVDVSKSYRDTVRQTVRMFFKGAPSWDKLPDPLFSLDDLAGIKQSGGLNNDWELTYHVLDLLMTQVSVPGLPDEIDPWLLHDQTLKGCNLVRLIDFLTSHGSPLDHLHQETGKYRSLFMQKMSSNDVRRADQQGNASDRTCRLPNDSSRKSAGPCHRTPRSGGGICPGSF